ncbi:ribonuclease H-like domain-containing protein [Tanacetum coccineum]|uniref:Ribonuclease H-like domain-containing protein n=1 Tax=Tanacetum coccineum TaxID=301880 RepID=A0ABQ4XSK8_9ASTR
MPSRPELSFAGLDDSVYRTNVSETISSVPRIESAASKSSKDSLEQLKDVRHSAPIIEEWESDSDDDCMIRPSFEENKPSYAKINFVKSDENTRKSVIEQHTYRQAENLRKSQSPRVDKRNWNGIMTQKLGDGFEFNKKACFVCGTVATKSGLVPVNAAKQSSPRAATSISTARHVNTATLKQKVNAASPIKSSYFKAYSPLRRPFNQKSAAKANNFNKKVYTTKVNNVTTAGTEVVVSTAEGKRENAGNPQYALQDQDIFDSRCSRHMTGNKSYLTDCDNGTEFKNNDMNQFYEMKGIKREFSVARTPQQNRVAKRKNITLIEAARTMLADSLLPTTFWAKAVNSACYVQNRVIVTKPHNKTPYELLLGSGPEWLFDIDSLTKSMNYKPVTVGNQTNGDAVIETNVNAKQAGQEKASDYEYILLLHILSKSPLSLKGYANNTNRVSTVNPSVSTAGQGFDNADDQERIDSST